jgi:hypothetical protein
MGFGTIGHPAGELSEENIKQSLKVYFPIWLSELNVENYEKNVFSLDLKIYIKSKIEFSYNENKTSLIENQRSINNHIIWELKNLTGLIEWIESVFDFYKLDKHRITSCKNEFEIEDRNIEIKYKNKKSNEIIDFIIYFKNNNSISNWRRLDWVQEKINECSEREILYFCINMYLDFLKIEEFLKNKYNHDLPKVPEFKAQTKKLTIDKIALKLVYEGASLPREKANIIITDYGHTSGEKLFQRFTFYSNESNRRANPSGTIKVLKNKIKLFESVIELLPNEKRSKAIDEVKYLKVFLVSLE